MSVPPGRAEQATQRFGCCTAELNRLANWLKECGVDTVVMEATGNYWVVLYDLLEQRGLRPVVVNPRYAKNMSGKKRTSRSSGIDFTTFTALDEVQQ